MSNMYIDTTSYTNKDFRSIWPELLELVTDLTDSWDPNNSNESDPGVALLKLKAFIADKLNYNIDKNTLENFPSAVTLRGNAQKIYDSLGYQLKWYVSAETDLYFKFVNSSENPLSADNNVIFTVPQFALIKNAEGTIIYTTLEQTTLDNQNLTKTEIPVRAIEGPVETFTINGSDIITINNLDADYRLYFNESMIATNGIFINNVGISDFWQQSFNLESTQLGLKVFKFGVMPTTNQCYIEFPQDAAELFDQGIIIHYVISSGTAGNIKLGSLTSFAQDYKTGVDANDENSTYSLNEYIRVTNPAGTANGLDPESLESAYKNFLKTVNTFSTLVTLMDYENAIYNEGDISNCVVTDRTTDFNFAYNVKSRTNIGQVTVPISTAVDNIGTKMSAFNLALYAFNKVSDVYDINTYRRSFLTSYDAVTQAKNSISEYKSVLHDWLDTHSNNTNLLAYLFKNLVNISGLILTRNKVSTTEAKDIIKNIRNHLYNTYQSRNLTFGAELDYDELINSILAADDRIKTVILNDLDYDVNVMYANNNQYPINNIIGNASVEYMLLQLKLEILARSILAGVTPLFLFDDTIDYFYTMGPSNSYIFPSNVEDANGNIFTPTTEASGDAITEAYSNISAITTLTEVKLIAKSQTGRKLLNNESVFIYAPSFISKTTIGTYLYVALLDTATNITANYPSATDDNVRIPAGTIYQLRPSQTLYVCETTLLIDNEGPNSSARKGIPTTKDGAGSKQWKVYTGGTIIKPSFDLTRDNFINTDIETAADGNSVLYIKTNLESDKSIEILDANVTEINKKDNLLDGQVGTKTVYCTWITDDINNYLFTDYDISNASNDRVEHILQLNEIFIYTDATKSDLIILQSGTKISIPYSSSSFDRDLWKVSKPSASDVNLNGIDAKLDWLAIPRNVTYFKVEELEIRSLGSGVTLYNNSNSNYTFKNAPVRIDNPEDISWKVDDSSDAQSLPEYLLISNDVKWYAFSRLAILSTPATINTLEDNLSVVLYSAAKITNQVTNKEEYIYEAVGLLGHDQSFMTDLVLITSGGTKQWVETVVDDVTKKLSFDVFRYRPISTTTGAQSLWTISSADANKCAISITESAITSAIETKITIKSGIGASNSIILTCPLSGLFNNYSIIPIIVEAPQSVKFQFNLDGIDGTNFKTAQSLSKYTNQLFCLKYTNEGNLRITISELAAGNTILINLYPPKKVIKFNTDLYTEALEYKYYWKKPDNTYELTNITSDITAAASVGDILLYDNKLYLRIATGTGIPSNTAVWELVETITTKDTRPTSAIATDPKIIMVPMSLSEFETSLLNKIKQLATRNLPNSAGSINIFDYTYTPDDTEKILNPLNPISFFDAKHICNKIIIPEIEQINILVARLSLN